jgi:non-ribosomal peptide synthetase component E (peptide arylation enzyme)
MTDGAGIVATYGEDAEAYRRAGEWGNRTIPDVLHDWAGRRGNALAVATIEGALTYAELDSRSDAVALGLVDAGLEPGDPVLFQMGNELETIVAWYGVLKAGAISVCSIPNHRLHEMSLIAGATGARGHVFQADYRNYDLEDLSAELGQQCADVAVRVVARGPAPEGVLSLEAMVERADPARAREVVTAIRRDRSSEDLAVFQLTSGTTGTPKVIPHTHASYLSIAARWSKHLGWNERSVNLHFIPIMHHAGLGTIMTPTHFAGGTMVVARGVDAELIAELIERYDVTAMHLNAAGAQPLVDYHAKHGCEFSSVTHFMCPWGATRPELASRVEEMLGAVGLGTFGMGEGVHLVARPDHPVEIRRFTLGPVIGPMDEVVVRRPGADEPVPDGEVGELTFRGPSVIRTYLAPEHTATAFTADGFLRSGDLGKALMIGGVRCFTLEGRLKDQLSRGGEKFMADELESLLSGHPEVREVAAIGVPDPRLGERVCVVVVPQQAGDPMEPEALRLRLVEYLDQRGVAKFKWPERLVLVDELPKTGTGKVQKGVLRDRVVLEIQREDVRS